MSAFLIVIWLLLFLTVAFAWASDGTPERICAGAMLCLVIFDQVIRALISVDLFRSFQEYLMAMDLLLALIVVGVAILANRIWPLFAAGLLLIPVLADLVSIIVPYGMQVAYWALNQLPFYCSMVVVLIGSVCAGRRKKRGLSTPDWSPAIGWVRRVGN